MKEQALKYLRVALNNPDADFHDGQWESIDGLINQKNVNLSNTMTAFLNGVKDKKLKSTSNKTVSSSKLFLLQTDSQPVNHNLTDNLPMIYRKDDFENNNQNQSNQPLLKNTYKGLSTTFKENVYTDMYNFEKVYDISGVYGRNCYYNSNSTVVKEFAYLQDQNKPHKLNMEDYSRTVEGAFGNFKYLLMSIYDGHGGQETAKYCKDSFINNFKKHFDRINSHIEDINNDNTQFDYSSNNISNDKDSKLRTSNNNHSNNNCNYNIKNTKLTLLQQKKENSLIDNIKLYIRSTFLATDDGSKKVKNKDAGSTGLVALIINYQINNTNTYNSEGSKGSYSSSKSKNSNNINNSNNKSDNNTNITRKLLFVANVGDTACYIVNNKNDCKKLTIDHKCSDILESQRVTSCGGTILYGRVMGELIVTRAFGDHKLKAYGVSAEPYINTLNISEEKEKWLILASDGICDALNTYDLISTGKNIKTSEEFCRFLVKLAISRGSKDNISCLVVKL